MTVWVATYEGYSYDALAIGKTKQEAVAALKREWNRQFPNNEMTAADWRDEIYVRKMEAGDCKIS